MCHNFIIKLFLYGVHYSRKDPQIQNPSETFISKLLLATSTSVALEFRISFNLFKLSQIHLLLHEIAIKSLHKSV